MSRWWAAVAGLLGLLFAACAGDSTAPEDRAVSITTTACGHASRTTGAGVIVDDGWVLASAHVVSGAGSVEVRGSFGSTVGEIVVVDADADLAMLRVDGAEAAPVRVAAAEVGDAVMLGGGGPSGVVATTVLRPVEVRIEAVRSTERISRLGYEIDTRVALGDSGGGVFDAEGALIGVVFGRPLEDVDRSFVVRHEELERVLAADRSANWRCDPTKRRVVSDAG